MGRILITKKGFTLLEIMIVIAIIGVLAATLYPAVGKYFERAKITGLYKLSTEIRTAAEAYFIDKEEYPNTVCERNYPQGDSRNCTIATDPFYQYGVSIYDKTTPWGGAVDYNGTVNLWEGSEIDPYIMFNDDYPYMGSSDNGGSIPRYILDNFDKKFDDADVGTGRYFGDAMFGTLTGSGEYIMLLGGK